RVQDVCAQDRARQDQKHWNNSNEDIGDDQPVAQAPQQLVSSPTDQAEQQIDAGAQRKKLSETKESAAQANGHRHHAKRSDGKRDDIKSGEAPPECREVGGSGHEPSTRRDTLPEERDEPKRRLGSSRAGSGTPAPGFLSTSRLGVL